MSLNVDKIEGLDFSDDSVMVCFMTPVVKERCGGGDGVFELLELRKIVVAFSRSKSALSNARSMTASASSGKTFLSSMATVA